MNRLLHVFRHIGWIAILCSLSGSLLMFIVGAEKTFYAFSTVIYGHIPKEKFSHLESSDIASAYLIKSLDAFLIAFVLFIFAYGIHGLFISKHDEKRQPEVLAWIRMPSINHLKKVLGEVIIVILFVKFLEVALLNLDSIRWKISVLPISILLLAMALKKLNLEHDDECTLASEDE